MHLPAEKDIEVQAYAGAARHQASGLNTNSITHFTAYRRQLDC